MKCLLQVASPPNIPGLVSKEELQRSQLPVSWFTATPASEEADQKKSPLPNHLTTDEMEELPIPNPRKLSLNKYACPRTDCEFQGSINTVRSHFRKDHLQLGPQKCSTCQYQSFNVQCFQEHVKKCCTAGSKLKCDLCSFTTCKPWTLKRHMSCHSSSKDFQCKECLRKFKQKQGLRRHERLNCKYRT